MVGDGLHGGKRVLDPVVELAHQQLLALLDAFALGNIVEYGCHPVLVWFADAKSINVVPAIQGVGLVLKANGLAGARHLSIGLVPEWLIQGGELAYGSALGAWQPGLLHKGAVHLQKSVIVCISRLVEEHFNDAKTLIDGLEQGAVLFFAHPERGFCFLAYANVYSRTEPLGDLPV